MLPYRKTITTFLPQIKSCAFASKTSETCHSLNHKLGRAIRIHEYTNAMGILNSMKESGCAIEPAQYSMVLKLYCDQELLKKADVFVNSHAEFANVVEANAVLHAHCRKGDVKGAINFFKKMKELGINHDEQSYLEIIRVLSKDYHKVLEMLFKMEQENIIPNLAIYTDVLFCLAKNHKYKEAIKVYRDMITNGIKPEEVVYNLVLEIATLAHDKELCQEIVVDMWDQHINIHPQVFEPIRHLADDLKNHNHHAANQDSKKE